MASGKCLDSPCTDSPGARKQHGIGAGPGAGCGGVRPGFPVSPSTPSPNLECHRPAGPIHSVLNEGTGSEAAPGSSRQGAGGQIPKGRPLVPQVTGIGWQRICGVPSESQRKFPVQSKKLFLSGKKNGSENVML